MDHVKSKVDKLRGMMNEQNLNGYIKSVIEISFITNKYINDTEPWSLKKKDINRMNTVLFVALDQIAKISILLNPIIPNSTTKVLNALNIKKNFINLSFIEDNKVFKNDIKIDKLEILYKKF